MRTMNWGLSYYVFGEAWGDRPQSPFFFHFYSEKGNDRPHRPHARKINVLNGICGR